MTFGVFFFCFFKLSYFLFHFRDINENHPGLPAERTPHLPSLALLLTSGQQKPRFWNPCPETHETGAAERCPVTPLLSRSCRRGVRQPGPWGWLQSSAPSHWGRGAQPLPLDSRLCHRPPANHKGIFPAQQMSFKAPAGEDHGCFCRRRRQKLLPVWKDAALTANSCRVHRAKVKRNFRLLRFRSCVCYHVLSVHPAPPTPSGG